MAPEFTDPRMTSIKPRIRYNTIGGVNGPLVFLDNVCCALTDTRRLGSYVRAGQISAI